MTITESVDLSKYPKDACYSVMKFVRRRIKAGRYIPECQDLARQYTMDESFVAQLLETRLRAEEKPEWARLSNLPHNVPAVRAGQPIRPISRPGPAKVKGTIRKGHYSARGWERYPLDQLEKMCNYVLLEMNRVRRGDGVITNYYLLRQMFGISVGVIGDFLRSDTGIGEILFKERNRLSKIRR